MTPPSAPASASEGDVAKGLAGIVAGQTAISSLEGTLRYRGYAIEPLAAAGDFEEVAYLLIHGELPRAAERQAFAARVQAAARALDPAVLAGLSELARKNPHASPMDALRTGVSMLGLVEGDDALGSHGTLVARAERLLGQTPAVLAAWIDMTAGRAVGRWPDAPLAAALLERLTGRTPSAEQQAIFGTTLVLYAEHEFNASTFTARTITSTGGDMHSAITGAIGALKGPLHGGANEKVLEVLREIGSVDRVEPWLQAQFEARRVVMGFGHRVYKHGDVRARLLGERCRALVRGTDMEPLEALADRVETRMAETKGLRPNLDWPAARVYHALGLPVKVFTPIFVVSRMSGWTAHVIEQAGDNRLIRPLSRYSGVPPREYVAVTDRG
jgi:citrate synthase